MDHSYLIVRIDNTKNIELYCFFDKNMNLKYNYPTCFTACSNQLSYFFNLVSLSNLFNALSTSHKIYCGIELFKVHISTKLEQSYIQE